MKHLKPTTPSSRGSKITTYKGVLTVSRPKKSLVKSSASRAGRNSAGRITTRHQGGGHKRRLRAVDFRYDKIGIPAKVETIEYDPYRSGFISLVCYQDGERRYVLAPKSLTVGKAFIVSEDAPITTGNRLPLRKMPVGTFVYNVEMQKGGGAKIARSAGVFAELIAHDEGKAFLKMPSGEVRKVPETCFACVGEVGNPEHKLRNEGKAGRNRWRGIRPTVRGSAMNPVDHPHGGGEGRQSIGLRRGPKTREGKLAYGVKTRRAKKYSDTFIISGRKTKKRK